MNKSALIFDLDNTIYPVHSIGEKLFNNLFALIEKSGEFDGNFEEIKLEIQRTPFEKVAEDFAFSKALFKACLKILVNLSYNEPMHCFEDYEMVRKMPIRKFLVTSGFSKLQNSKIDQLNIRGDFEAIYIIDRQLSERSKKDVFIQIIQENKFRKEEVLVIGDDISSEINAGNELGIETLLYDRNNTCRSLENQQSISRFTELTTYI